VAEGLSTLAAVKGNMEAEMAVDFNKANALLNVVHKCVNLPAMASLSGLALAELTKMNAEAEKELEKVREEAEKKAAAEKKALADTEAKEKAHA
jgi:hypothetical protein